MLSRRTAVTLTLLALLPAAAAVQPRPAADVARIIDAGLAARWQAAKIAPAAAAADAEFLRRVYLDLTGTIPSVPVTRAFLEDPAPDKRTRLVDRLLQGGAYVRHFASVWRAALLPDGNGQEDQNLKPSFEAWLRDCLQKNLGYDRMIRAIVTLDTQRQGRRGGLAFDDGTGGLSPAAFSLALENKPENLAAASSRLFLGVRLECAQCHNHPFAKWSREQFWEFAAFYTPVGRNGKVREIKIPSTDKTVTAKFLDGKAPANMDRTDPRTLLADWLTAPENPFFARAAVNRLWAYFFGAGLLEPIDDLGQDDAQDALLEELARAFAASKFDLKALIRGIVLSKAYGLTSRGAPAGDDLRVFARMAVRGLAPEQIFDSLVEATRSEGVTGAVRTNFLARFTNQAEKRTEYHTTILQALDLMNGKLLSDATSPERSATLGAVADAPFLSTEERVEAIFLAALTRLPRPQEKAKFIEYVDRGGPTGDKRQALADVFWALLNSSEFLFNH